MKPLEVFLPEVDQYLSCCRTTLSNHVQRVRDRLCGSNHKKCSDKDSFQAHIGSVDI